jgi:hypothetical protein
MDDALIGFGPELRGVLAKVPASKRYAHSAHAAAGLFLSTSLPLLKSYGKIFKVLKGCLGCSSCSSQLAEPSGQAKAASS